MFNRGDISKALRIFVSLSSSFRMYVVNRRRKAYPESNSSHLDIGRIKHFLDFKHNRENQD